MKKTLINKAIIAPWQYGWPTCRCCTVLSFCTVSYFITFRTRGGESNKATSAFEYDYDSVYDATSMLKTER